MTLIYYLISVLTASGVFCLLHFLGHRVKLGKLNLTKIVCFAYIALFFVRFMGGDYALQETVGLNVSSPFGPQGNILALLSALLIWFGYAAMLVTASYPFFGNSVPCLVPLTKYFASTTHLFTFAGIGMLNRAMDGALADGFHYRLLIFAIEIGVALGLSIRFLLEKRPEDKPLVIEEKHTGSVLARYAKLVLIYIGMIVISIPPWVPKCLFGYAEDGIVVEDLNLYHRLTLYASVLLGLAIFFLFRRGSEEEKRYAMIYISTATMIGFSFNYDFSNFLDPISWPIHLCNTAMYIIPLVLIFKMHKLYYFTLFINVLGAFLAMVMPNTDGANLLSDKSWEFWINHYMAFLLPILIIALGIFRRPKIKEFTYSLIAFFGYYVLVLILNAWLSNYDASVDFFFINSDFIASKLGKWAEDLREITASFHIGDLKFLFYPVYQILFFGVYIILSFAMWFLYEQAFEVADTYAIIEERKRKIAADRLALEVHLAGRSMQQPMNPENEGRLILRHFSKRYSTSDVYSAYDVNLEIDGGQIFGFLGPNGAGKSTIIKSIVGIQTITSGEIEVSGYDVEKQSVGAKMQIGFVPDHYALYENLTGREYLNYIADLYHVSREERDRRIDEFVRRFRLESAIDNPIKTYSHGMKQKITLMSALVHSPKIWILDEPLTGLDPESIFQVKEAMKEHAAKGNIVFFSSHIIDVVENICDRIAIIRKGQILCVRTVAEIKESGVALENFYMDMIDGNTQPPVSVKEAEALAAGGANV